MMMQGIAQALGWWGMLILLGAFIAISRGKITAKSKVYQVANILGSLGIATDALWNGALPAAAMNIVWAGIAAYFLLRLFAQMRGQ